MSSPIIVRATAAVLVATLLACGGTDDPGDGSGTGGDGGTGGGLLDTGCPAGELITADGSCLLNSESEYFSFSILFEFENLGGNHCGCDTDQHDCQALSTGLQPPHSVLP